MGLANIYLPGIEHQEKYAITAHPSTSSHPIKEKRQHKLYEREGNHFLFQMYGQGIKKMIPRKHKMSQPRCKKWIFLTGKQG